MPRDPITPFFEFKVEEVIKSPMFFLGGNWPWNMAEGEKNNIDPHSMFRNLVKSSSCWQIRPQKAQDFCSNGGDFVRESP